VKIALQSIGVFSYKRESDSGRIPKPGKGQILRPAIHGSSAAKSISKLRPERPISAPPYSN
jgi:hypothetical protein